MQFILDSFNRRIQMRALKSAFEFVDQNGSKYTVFIRI